MNVCGVVCCISASHMFHAGQPVVEEGAENADAQSPADETAMGEAAEELVDLSMEDVPGTLLVATVCSFSGAQMTWCVVQAPSKQSY